MRLITLTTDFGYTDWFVGTMKGVILGLNPRAQIVDLTHEIPLGEIRAGAFALASGYRFFPKGAIHVAVVDPGVGSKRKAIAIQTASHLFVGPDNGVLSWAVVKEKIESVRALENHAFFVEPVSQTFHGRDIFAPVAAHLSRGVAFSELGPPVNDFVRLPWPEPRPGKDRIAGKVIYLDRFGNGITNIREEALGSLSRGSLTVSLNGRRLCTVVSCYEAVPLGQPLALLGSSGFLEIALRDGNAELDLGLRIGDSVVVGAA
jgi:S-adenosylmethionine hydrolase